MNPQPSTVLAIVAHADDETIGLGGTLARHAAAGDAVFVLVMTDGEGARGQATEAAIDARRTQCREACDLLGVKEVFFESFPDNAMDSLPRLQLARSVEHCIAQIRPDTIYTHHQGDVNIDHVLTSEAVTIAARAQPSCSVRRILHFETVSSTEWQLPQQKCPFHPNWFVDINEFWDIKKNSLSIYTSEMRNFPHSRSIQALDALSTWRGASAGIARAEAFMLVRAIL